jgi:putative transposase
MIKSYSFYCSDLNKKKTDLLLQKAVELRDFKNQISKEVCSNFSYFNEISKFDWITYFRTQLPNCNNQDISNAISDVYDSYENKRNKFIQNISFKVQKEIKYTYYKNNGKTYKKGDVRDAEVILGSNKFTKCLTYLCRYWNPNFISWLEENKDLDEKKAQLRNDALSLFKKYPERITVLIISHRTSVINELVEHPITFNSLSFRSCNELRTKILNRNKNLQAIFGAIITLGGQKTSSGKLHIPVKYSYSHHGNIDDYDKSPNAKGVKTISYTVCFYKNKIRFVLGKTVDDELPITDKNEYYGIDLNVKHNLFCDKHGQTIDYDRRIFQDYVNFLKTLDSKHQYKKQHNLNLELSKKDQDKYDTWTSRIKDMLKRKSNQLVKQAITQGKNHIVMEDLGQFCKSFSRSEDFDGFKYSRLIKMLNLSDLKNIVKSIANKHGIQVSFVHSHYTSQTCSKCGFISRENRKSQETFSCLECGHTNNADSNSAENIENRMSVDDLQVKLLLSDNGSCYPKKLGKATIISILHDYYSQKEINKLE